MPPFIRSPYNYDITEASDASAIVPVGESLTVQSQSEDADINVMMKRFGVTGKFPDPAPLLPTYGDFTQVTDFRGAWEACARASENFMKYPAEFRARFDNDPQKFLSYVEEPGNIPEMKQLGLFGPGAQNSVNVLNPAGGVAPPQGNPASQESRAGAPIGNSGAGVSNAAPQSGSSVSGGKS